MTVDLFIPCFIDQFCPEVAEATVKVLRKAGVEVEYNPEQTCCGSFAYNAGLIEEAKQLGDNTARRPSICMLKSEGRTVK